MNEPWTLSAGTLISLLASALAGVCVYFLKRNLDKIEQLDAECVRKRELKELEERLLQDQERLSQDQREMHEQNKGTMGDIRNDIRELRTRVDGAFNRGGGR